MQPFFWYEINKVSKSNSNLPQWEGLFVKKSEKVVAWYGKMSLIGNEKSECWYLNDLQILIGLAALARLA